MRSRCLAANGRLLGVFQFPNTTATTDETGSWHQQVALGMGCDQAFRLNPDVHADRQESNRSFYLVFGRHMWHLQMDLPLSFAKM